MVCEVVMDGSSLEEVVWAGRLARGGEAQSYQIRLNNSHGEEGLNIGFFRHLLPAWNHG